VTFGARIEVTTAVPIGGHAMRRHLLYSALALASLASTSTAAAQPVRVFVTPVEAPKPAKPTEADRQAASAAYDVADTARKTLEKSLKAQYGGKRDKWPVEAQQRLADAEEARDRANADWLYRVDAEPLGRFWAHDVAEALTKSGMTGRKEHITSVPSAEQAQLIVTLTAVRNPSAVINAADDRCLSFRLTNGPKVSAEQFARVPRTYRPARAQAKRLAAPADGSPVWQFEGCGLYPYFKEDEAIANIVNDFAGANLAVLVGSAGQ